MSQVMASSPQARCRRSEAATLRSRSTALRRAVVTSQPAGLSGTPRVAQAVEAATQASCRASSARSKSPRIRDEAGQHPAAVGAEDGLERFVHRTVAAASGIGAQGYISATGRTSTEPNLAEGTMAAHRRAWSRSSKSMM